MRAASIVAVVIVLALAALTLLPEASAYQFQLTLAAIVAAGVALVTLLADRQGKAVPPPAEVRSIAPPPAPVVKNQADAEVVSFLATLQDKGRLVDFLMEDITAYNDSQVSAAARVVHAGCKAVLQEHFSIRPIRDESEGAVVSVAAGYTADEYRLVGAIRGEAPFSGTLVHRGWKTEGVKLARVLRQGDRLPAIAPAEIELK